ncbi:spermine synthase isoform X2 [Nematostella vectensis]|uniref:spermine synthase isoform X2 n=1 Tax=Nematostella vectensis TaxID=45351 RepID=UPI0020777E95|nr:spermine synthase isoform X2 [Nematostella vectensis]
MNSRSGFPLINDYLQIIGSEISYVNQVNINCASKTNSCKDVGLGESHTAESYTSRMMIKHSLLDFKVPPDICLSSEQIEEKISAALHKHLQVKGPVFTQRVKGFGDMLIYEATTGKSHCTVHILPGGLITLDIMFNDEPNNNEKLDPTFWYFLPLRKSIEDSLFAKTSAIPPITRGREINPYYDTSDGRLKEYDFDRVVYHEQSPYQDILIMHSPQFGNMLFLDEIEMLAESDIAYTRAITGNGNEDFEDKTVLILGGGDGGIIHELLKENPRFITMVEIDQLVINAARKHLPGICGSTLGSLEGPTHKIIVGDCIAYLRNCIREDRKFDYVINDLTDIPINLEIQDSHWDFIRDCLNLSLQVLSPGGKYFAQGTNGATNYEALKVYEDQLKQACFPIGFQRHHVFVPSFMEQWTIYEVWKTETNKAST